MYHIDRSAALVKFWKKKEKPAASASSSFLATTPCLGTCAHAKGRGDWKRATTKWRQLQRSFWCVTSAVGPFSGARFQSPLPRSWEHMFEQGVVAKKLELAETTGLFCFFQNVANAVLLAAWYKIRLLKTKKTRNVRSQKRRKKRGGVKKNKS